MRREQNTENGRPEWRLARMAALTVAGFAFVIWAVYISTQQPKFSWNSEQLGLILLKDNYRSYFLRFADGHSFDPTTGKWRPVTMNEQAGKIRFGYHWPTFSHINMKRFLSNDPAVRPAPSAIHSTGPATIINNPPKPETNVNRLPPDITKGDPL